MVYVDSKDEDDQTPLFAAAKYGHQDVVQCLLDTGKVDIESKDKDGLTPLVSAALGGYRGIVQLLDAGSSITQDEKCRTRLSYVAENGHLDVLEMLNNSMEIDVNAEENLNQSALSWAV
ncbi:hypothetical protein N7468_001750 [Penicillium chermesinum]|uniref:Ankyrin repeat protein n=1 Tax=Penicillium chermesinum TaxID=63820 RepID=A0A9W9PIH0_9EURO|nr:uncharacterized protein N7468_001750 [Penicillium chermesinum]KAJ5246767.1 hypothetical protein N7468_001750 [Penicillium chermesinum]KAJ6145031.1 hypothetical protein N7470_008926 [Penicillium chermesinum]